MGRQSEPRESNPSFDRVVRMFSGDREVEHGGGKKGFGSAALKVRGKIFAMMSSKGHFVVKLPKERVAELAVSGLGQAFDPGHGRRMKEWLEVHAEESRWTELAREAYRFVKGAAD